MSDYSTSSKAGGVILHTEDTIRPFVTSQHCIFTNICNEINVSRLYIENLLNVRKCLRLF